LASTDAYYNGSGAYVSMVIDRSDDDTIHLAFYNSRYKTVVYAYGKTGSTFTAVAVDNGITGAAWTDIALDEDKNPYITYLDISRAENYGGAKMAYLNKTKFTAESTDANSGKVNTGWEALNVPAVYRVSDGRLNVEAWPPANAVTTLTGFSAPYWTAAVGYQSDKFRIAYYIKP
jgi:hypothetical protein